jgi:hypothetical protein
LGMTLSRPDIMVFKPAFDQAGTLTESWDGWINLFGDYSARIGAHAGFPPDPDWKPIPPNTSGVLLNLVLELYCGIPDTMQDRTARVEINVVSCMP